MVELINPNGVVVDVAESAVKRKLAAGWTAPNAKAVESKAPAPKTKKSSGKSGSKKQESSPVEESE